MNAKKGQPKQGALEARATLARRVLEIEAATPAPENGEEWSEIGVSADEWNELVALAKAGQPPKGRR